MEKAHVEWSKKMFDALNEDGVWGVPRSGLTFQRKGGLLILVSRMPWQSGMPLNAQEWGQYQEQDYGVIRQYMRAAGIEVADATRDQHITA